MYLKEAKPLTIHNETLPFPSHYFSYFDYNGTRATRSPLSAGDDKNTLGACRQSSSSPEEEDADWSWACRSEQKLAVTVQGVPLHSLAGALAAALLLLEHLV